MTCRRQHPIIVFASVVVLCLFLPAIFADALSGNNINDEQVLHRNLQSGTTRECGQVIGVITVDQVRAAGRTLLGNFLNNTDDNDSLLDRSVNIMFFPAQYDLTVIKLCASCQSIADWFYDRGGGKFPGYHETYCKQPGNSDEWIDQTLSMLAFLPRDPTNFNQLPLRVKLRTFLTLPPTRTDVNAVPTVEFPADVTAALEAAAAAASGNGNNDNTNNFVPKYLPGMLAASAGALALFPDPVGTGESAFTDGAYRSMYLNRAYEHATAVSYLGLKQYVTSAATSGTCTALDDAVTLYGAEDGAFAAVAATQVLQRFNVRALTTFLAAGPLDLERLLQDAVLVQLTNSNNDTNTSIIDTSTNNTSNSGNTTSSSSSSSSLSSSSSSSLSSSTSSSTLKEWIQLAAFTLSADIPGVANTGSNSTTLVADEWKRALRAVFNPKPTASVNSLPDDPIDLLNPDFVELVRRYGIAVAPCNATVYGAAVGQGEAGTVSLAGTADETPLCQAVLQSSVIPLLLSQTDRVWASNVSACYSDKDEIVSPRHYEDPRLAGDAELQMRYWKRYTQPTGLDALVATGGDHATALQLCSIAPLLFFTLQGHRPDAVEDRGNYMPAMSAEELATCVPIVPDATEAPLGPPSTSPQPTVTQQPTRKPAVAVVVVAAPTSPSAAGGPGGDGSSPNGGSGGGSDMSSSKEAPSASSSTGNNNNNNNNAASSMATQRSISHVLFSAMGVACFLTVQY